MHETGHALGLLLSTKGRVVRVYLGRWDNSNGETMRFGRLRLHLSWGYAGLCSYDDKSGKLSKIQEAFFMIGGPIFSLLVAFGLTLLLYFYPIVGDIRDLVLGLTVFNYIQFLCTIIPIKYPSWWQPYAGMPSDGYQILHSLKSGK